MVVKVDPRAENLDKLFLIYADIKTESLRKLKILQIAAVTHDGDTFCSFINPGEPCHLMELIFMVSTSRLRIKNCIETVELYPPPLRYML